MTEAQYTPPCYDEQLIKDFLSWCGREHGGVVVDITQAGQYTFLNHTKLIKEWLEGKK